MLKLTQDNTIPIRSLTDDELIVVEREAARLWDRLNRQPEPTRLQLLADVHELDEDEDDV